MSINIQLWLLLLWFKFLLYLCIKGREKWEIKEKLKFLFHSNKELISPDYLFWHGKVGMLEHHLPFGCLTSADYCCKQVAFYVIVMLPYNHDIHLNHVVWLCTLLLFDHIKLTCPLILPLWPMVKCCITGSQRKLTETKSRWWQIHIGGGESGRWSQKNTTRWYSWVDERTAKSEGGGNFTSPKT